ncbi:hybrid sensor histidine kinase/response regulator [Microvirga massiliensis]|uniref:hybrid sensor histidine kinase/response regulator n=1 Tax=Microvirga massiliensis TaxID=1033741 RepID=UPI00069C7CDB|nr:hybrid sensor histidine kinase/response regulator [Microvirga massiliensis]
MTDTTTDTANSNVRAPAQPALIRALRALIFASLFLPAVLLAAAAFHDWQRLNAAVERRAYNTAAILREHALKVFQTHELVLDRVDERIRGMTWEEIERSEDVRLFLRGIATGLDYVSSLLLVRPDGQLSSGTRSSPLPQPMNVADRDYFLVPKSDSDVGIYIGKPIIGRVSGEPIINVSRRRSSPTGDFDGVIAVAVTTDYFNRFYRTVSAGADSVTLVRADGTVLVREAPAVTSGEILSPLSGLMRGIAAGDSGLYETASELDQVRRLHAYEKVGPYPLYVSYGVCLAAVQQEWLKGVMVHGFFAALASMGLATITWIALRQAHREQAAVERWRGEAIERERAEHLYRALYNRAPIPQQSLDANGALLTVSDTWLELLGYDRQAVIGRLFQEFLPQDQQFTFDQHRARLLESGKVRDLPLEVLRRSGERVPILWSATVERNREGRFVQTLGALVDATERRRAEKGLAQLQKVEAIGQLTGGVAHDFNNLLQALSGCLHLIDKGASEPRLKAILEAGQQAVGRGARLTQQLMGFARREALRPEPVDIPDQVLGMSELLTRALRENIKINLELEHGLWPALVDPTQFEMAILNLAVNARDAMPSGGTLRVTGMNCTFGPGEQADGLVGDFVRLTISDTGSGMPPEVLEHVFDPFFTTKEAGKGTGLGLSQVYGFARQAGGTVQVESAPGEGTRVYLLLPRSMQAAVAERKVRSSNGTLDGLKVLFVEDDPIVRAMVGAALEDLGCEVTRTASAEEALEALQKGVEAELLFSDVVMPGMTGVELAKEARLLRPGLGIVLTTGYSEDAARLSGTRVLAKPYRIETLVKILAEEMNKRRSSH